MTMSIAARTSSGFTLSTKNLCRRNLPSEMGRLPQANQHGQQMSDGSETDHLIQQPYQHDDGAESEWATKSFKTSRLSGPSQFIRTEMVASSYQPQLVENIDKASKTSLLSSNVPPCAHKVINTTENVEDDISGPRAFILVFQVLLSVETSSSFNTLFTWFSVFV
jgi:hypothetical protein